MLLGSDAALPALIGALGAVCVAALGLIGVLVQTRRNGQKLDEVVTHVNNVEAQTDGSGRKLTMREEIRAGFADNNADHRVLKQAIVDHEGRITGLEKEVAP